MPNEFDDPPRFASSRIKLARALKFIDELEVELKIYEKKAVSNPRMEIVNGQPTMVIHWSAFSLEAGAAMGDAVHNMRTSLDLMASELARINNQKDKGVYFPFADSEQSLSEQIKQKKFARAGLDAVALLETFSPYIGGNTRLRAIHDMDVNDKHRAILETNKTFAANINFLYDLDDPMSARLSIDNFTVEHSFVPDSPLAGLPLIQTLKELVELAEGILKAFDILVTKRA